MKGATHAVREHALLHNRSSRDAVLMWKGVDAHAAPITVAPPPDAASDIAASALATFTRFFSSKLRKHGAKLWFAAPASPRGSIEVAV